jgi:urease accessory protein
VQLGSGWLRLRTDHVIEDLLRTLGANVRAIEAPFTPEGGGYSSQGAAAIHNHASPAKQSAPANGALYRIMTWLSSAYPVGGFNYSHGIEYAVEAGLVRDRASLIDWVAAILCNGSGKVDGALFAAAWRATKVGDAAALDEIADIAVAWRGTAELALESSAQGTAFVSVTTQTWPDTALIAAASRRGGKLAFPVAVAIAMAQQVPLADAIAGYLTAFSANLVGAGVRLIPLGQTDGQFAVAALEPIVAKAATAALQSDLNALGTATPMLDWCSMRHETQYTRLFRS